MRVAREESITKAAESLHITQPTLSRQLSALVDKTEQEISEREGNIEGTISVAGGLLEANKDFIQLMKRFQKKIPWCF